MHRRRYYVFYVNLPFQFRGYFKLFNLFRLFNLRRHDLIGFQHLLRKRLYKSNFSRVAKWARQPNCSKAETAKRTKMVIKLEKITALVLYRVSQKKHSYKIFGLEIMLFTCSQTLWSGLCSSFTKWGCAELQRRRSPQPVRLLCLRAGEEHDL